LQVQAATALWLACLSIGGKLSAINATASTRTSQRMVRLFRYLTDLTY